MTDLNNLNLSDDTIDTSEVSLDDQPGGGAFETLQPGFQTFTLPEDLGDVFETQVDRNQKQRLTAAFSGMKGLRVRGQAGRFFYRVSNMERNYKGKTINEFSLLLAALRHKNTPTTNQQFGQALVSHAGESFRARVSWSTYCNPKKEKYGSDAKKISGSIGCGANYSEAAWVNPGSGKVTHAIPSNGDGKLLERFVCQCGAHLRVFPNLTSYQTT